MSMEGFVTLQFQREYLDAKVPAEYHKDPQVLTLNGHENESGTLYFWQLYSILGENKIRQFITEFYTNLFDEAEDIQFIKTFKVLGSIEHHIIGQTNFWLDAMGGGKKYAGGQFRLQRHHDLAKHIMNAKGARIWLQHMRYTLNTTLVDFTDDTRVKPCIMNFLNFFMEKYGLEYGFKARL